jgi:hypothetical protein
VLTVSEGAHIVSVMPILSWRVFVAATLAALPLLVALSVPAYACTCGFVLEDEVAKADLIVAGTAGGPYVYDDSFPTPEPLTEPNKAARTRFVGATVRWPVTVDQYVKGSGPSEIVGESATTVAINQSNDVIITPGLMPNCGYAPEPGLAQLFFLEEVAAEVYSPSNCGGGMPLDQQLMDDIRTLLAGPTPEPTAGALPQTGGGGGGGSRDVSWPVLGAGAAGVLLASVVLFVFRPRGDA